MRLGQAIPALRPSFMAFLFLCLLGPTLAAAGNKAVDMRVVRSPEGGVQCAFLLEESPFYTLKTSPDGAVLLLIHDTIKTPQIEKRVAESKGVMEAKELGSAALQFAMRPEASPREVNSSWLPREKTLFLELIPGPETGEQGQAVSQGGVLKRTLLGVHETHTRVVMELGKRPLWELVYAASRKVALNLDAVLPSQGVRELGPVKRLKRLSLKQEGVSTRMAMELDSSLYRVRVFWMNHAGKLVVDLFDRPMESPQLAVQMASGGEEKQGPPPPLPKVDLEKEEATPPSLVRGKIGKTGKGEASDEGEPSGLSPEEAMLFGSIRGAVESKDFETALSLVDQFLTAFPRSGKREELAFAKGDLWLALLKWGNKEAFRKAIESYQGAVSEFRGSDRVPGTFVKMALTNYLHNNDYAALGYLSMAMGIKQKDDHLPMGHTVRGKVLLRLQQPEKALEDFQTVLERFPHSPHAAEARLGIAACMHAKGLYAEAEKKLREIIESDRHFYLECPEYLLLSAKNAFYQKRYDQAREIYFKALNLGRQQESPDLLIAHIGDTYYHQSRDEESRKFYAMAIDDYPDSEGASIAKLRLAKGSSDMDAFEEIHQKNKGNPIGELALIEMANRHYEQGQYTMVIDSLRRLVEGPVRSDVQAKAKQLYSLAAQKEVKRLHEKQEHEKLVEFARSVHPILGKHMDPESMLLVGLSLLSVKQPSEAVALLQKIHPKDLSDPSKGRYFLGLAEGHMAQGNEESAFQLMDRAAKENLPALEQQKLVLLVADTYGKRGDMKRASSLYESIMTGKKALPDKELARICLLLGRNSIDGNLFERAKEYLLKGISLAEGDKGARDVVGVSYVELGNIHYRERRHREAVNAYRKAHDLEFGPDREGYWEARFNEALSYMELGEKVKAERLLREVSEGGDPLLQQKVQIRLGGMGLQRQLKRLPLGQEKTGQTES